MPYFSFAIRDIKKINLKNFCPEVQKIKSNQKYYSKSTKLWKFLNDRNNYNKTQFINFEKRYNVSKYNKKILFLLPPSIGLGDAVEYALAIKAVSNSQQFEKIGIAFVGRYKTIFTKYFNFQNIYEEVINEKKLKSFDTLFHVTLEIEELLFQKYNRKSIENLITSFFSVKKFKYFKSSLIQTNSNITIFPISASPIRCMPIELLNYIINNFYQKIDIEVVLDNQSDISNLIKDNINNSKIKISSPSNLSALLRVIEKLEFGIFMDSGPLHIAKILNKKGILITNTIDGKILLNNYNSIIYYKNRFKSKYCKSPCGLTNIFNYKNNFGCYNSLKINKKNILKKNILNSLQRGNLKKNYVKYISNPVECLKHINNDDIIQLIMKHYNSLK
tara:strand:- start:894 stop:2060 length:1167 start_codon:yes stop_codon:yes gene_type:complete